MPRGGGSAGRNRARRATRRTASDWDGFEHLINAVKHDLDALEYNIYHTFMLEVKKRLTKMVIPALIESQSLPGFITRTVPADVHGLVSGLQGKDEQKASMDDSSTCSTRCSSASRATTWKRASSSRSSLSCSS